MVGFAISEAHGDAGRDLFHRVSRFYPGYTTEEAKPAQKLPTFPEDVYTRLPEFLQRVFSIGETPEERDTLLIGSIVTLSAVMPNIYGYYDRAKVYANLYLGTPCSGWGSMLRIFRLSEILG